MTDSKTVISPVMDLAGDVEVVSSGREAGLQHWRAGAHERTCAVEHQIDVFQ
jgi:hypothetical protein